VHQKSTATAQQKISLDDLDHLIKLCWLLVPVCWSDLVPPPLTQFF